MSAQTLARSTRSRKAGPQSSRLPRTISAAATPASAAEVKGGNTSAVAKRLAKDFGRSAVARQHDLDITRATLRDLARLADRDSSIRHWLQFLLAPVAAFANGVELEGSIVELLDTMVAADVSEDLARHRYLQDPSPANLRKYVIALRMVGARTEEARQRLELAALEACHGH